MWYWDGIENYDQFSYIKEPLYPLFVAGSHALQIPLRMSFELALVGVCFFAARVIKSKSRSSTLAVLAYGVGLFHPYSVDVGNQTMSDGLYGVLGLLWTTTLLWALPNPGREIKKLLFMSTIGGLMVLTRPESILIYATSFIVIAYTGFVRKGILSGRFAQWKSMLIPVLSILLPMWIIGLAVKCINYSNVGFFAIAEQSEPRYQQALKDLMSIKPGYRVPYTLYRMETLEKLALHSPSAKEIHDQLNGSLGTDWRKVGNDAFKPQPPEIYAAYAHWALRDAVALAGHYKSPQSAMAFYGQLSSEINELFDQGIFEKQFVVSTGIGQGFKLFSLHYLNSTFSIWNQTIGPELKIMRDQPHYQSIKLWDEMALRADWSYQSYPTRTNNLRIRGWIFSESIHSSLKTVISTENRARTHTYPRPDVLASFSNKGVLTESHSPEIGFVTIIDQPTINDEVSFVFSDGTTVDLSINALTALSSGHSLTISNSVGSDVEIWLDETSWKDGKPDLAIINKGTAFYTQLAKIYPYLFYASLIVTLRYIFIRRKTITHQCLLAIILISAFPLLRVLMMGIQQGSILDATHARYAFPASLVLYLVPFFWIALLRQSTDEE